MNACYFCFLCVSWFFEKVVSKALYLKKRALDIGFPHSSTKTYNINTHPNICMYGVVVCVVLVVHCSCRALLDLLDFVKSLGVSTGACLPSCIEQVSGELFRTCVYTTSASLMTLFDIYLASAHAHRPGMLLQHLNDTLSTIWGYLLDTYGVQCSQTWAPQPRKTTSS
jgi:hypothetical protein